jgi:UDP-N-acetylmuramoyl-tripeptide--D-alanyl-D-alanine ligase
MNFITTEELYTHFIQSSGICTDTRKTLPNQLFFALKGDNFNGNQFAEKALEEGCSFAIVDEESFAYDARFLLVSNVLESLQQLSNFHRRKLKTPIIGITGSNGKTTTKEFATTGNLNNQIGVPLSLLNLKPEHQIAVIEMGASKPGDIKELAEIAEPNYGLITSIGKAHLEGMGGLNGVVKTKTELFDFIRNYGGGIFWETENEWLKSAKLGINRVVKYGKDKNSDYVGEIVSDSPFVILRWQKKDAADSFLVESNLSGRYNFANIMSAIAVGNYFGVSPEKISLAIASYFPDNNRAQFLNKGTNILILDAYNANPTSMEASIRNFAAQDFRNKILVLGEMMELGEHSANEHQNIIELVGKLCFKDVHFVGNQFYNLKELSYQYWQSPNELKGYFEKNMPKNSTVLFKGSRKNKLETIAEIF